MKKKYLTIIIVIAVGLIAIPFDVSYSKSRILSSKKGVIDKPDVYYPITGLVYWNTFDGRDINWTSGREQDATNTSQTASTSSMNNMSTTSTPTQGVIGQGFLFDGVNDYLQEASSTQTQMSTSPFTVSLWFKTKSTTASALFDKLHGICASTRQDDYWAVILNANGTMSFRVFDVSLANTFNATSNTNPGFITFNDGMWHHLVGVRNNSATISLWMDGAYATTTGGVSGVNLTTNGGINLGAFVYDGAPQCVVSPFAGSIDDARIYNYGLATSTIIQLYNSGRNKVHVN